MTIPTMQPSKYQQQEQARRSGLTESDIQQFANSVKAQYEKRKLPMGKTPDKQPTTTPVPPAPDGKVRTAFGNVTDPKPMPQATVVADFGDGNPVTSDELNKAFPRNENGEPVDPTPSPDEPDSAVAAPPTEDVVPEPVKTGEPPHWTEIEGMKAIFDKFVGGILDDFGLVDIHEAGSYEEVMKFMVKHGVEPKQYPTLGQAKDAFHAAAVKEFKDDLKLIFTEKDYPLTRNTLPDILKYETIDDALHITKGNMTGKGIRYAIAGHVTSWWQARILEQNNATASRNIAEQKAEQSTPVVETPKVEPIKQDVLIETAVEIAEIVIPEKPVMNSVIPFSSKQAIQRAKVYSDIVSHLYSDQVLTSGKDYGVIPGTGKGDNPKPTLLKAGAEKLCSAFGFRTEFKALDAVIDRGTSPYIFYRYECRLVNISNGDVIATAIGSCNSLEKKYRWRNMFKSQLQELGYTEDEIKSWPRRRMQNKTGKNGNYTLYQVENDEPFDLINTIDKMAQKRSMVAAVLIGCNASEFFSQDLEDLRDFGTIDAEIVG